MAAVRVMYSCTRAASVSVRLRSLSLASALVGTTAHNFVALGRGVVMGHARGVVAGATKAAQAVQGGRSEGSGAQGATGQAARGGGGRVANNPGGV